jgi:hypothetical protein
MMAPLEIISAAAARLAQEANLCRDRALAKRLQGNADAIRVAVASIRNAVASPDDRPRKNAPRTRLVPGDEGQS